jgi:hypothetical protein
VPSSFVTAMNSCDHRLLLLCYGCLAGTGHGTLDVTHRQSCGLRVPCGRWQAA